MNKQLRVLTVEDSEDDAMLLVRELQRGGYDPSFKRVETEETFSLALKNETWDIIISDYSMPGFSSPAALELLKKSGLDLPFIIVSGKIGEDTAVAAMKAGAHDYIMKDKMARLIPVVGRELREAEVRRQRKRVEEQFLQAQKMESIGRLAGGIAHDFNNLLTSILGYGHLALRRSNKNDPLYKDVEEMIKAGERAATLTRQLLAFSRKQILEPKVLQLNEIVSGINEMLSRLIGEDIDLVTVLSPELGHIKADSGQIEQVIMNLVVNARDAILQGGRIILQTDNVCLDEQSVLKHDEDMPPGCYAMLSVSDTGMGMSREVMSQIFEPFFTTKEQGKGTGLGLSTVYGIIKQSGGFVSVESTLGMGTKFNVYLPEVEKTAPVIMPEEYPAQPSHGSETILVVEDEEGVRKLVCRILQMQGYNVQEARDGVEALQIAEYCNGPIHLMLTDVVMPRMSGCELAKRLVAQRPKMKVLYMSGYTENEIVHNSILELDTAFIQKPFMPSKLVRKVRNILDAEVGSA